MAKVEETKERKKDNSVVYTDEDRKVLAEKFDNKFVCEFKTKNCSNCGIEFDPNTPSIKCSCGGDLKLTNHMHNPITGAWKKEAAN